LKIDPQNAKSSLPQKPEPASQKQKFLGLVQRRECWRLSLKGRVSVLAMVAAMGLSAFFFIHPFLAVTQRVDTRFLVVEGWVHEFAFAAAAKDFKAGGYQEVFATGGPIVGQGGYVNDAHTYASIGAAALVKAGIPAASVQMVPSRVMERDRTYGSAVALRDWLREHQVMVTALNVLTEDSHARRTRLLYEKAFGRQVRVGIISIHSPDYAPKDWWRNSEGVREVIDETIAYLYARLFF
jgi:hypothetical protein